MSDDGGRDELEGNTQIFGASENVSREEACTRGGDNRVEEHFHHRDIGGARRNVAIVIDAIPSTRAANTIFHAVFCSSVGFDPQTWIPVGGVGASSQRWWEGRMACIVPVV